MDLWSILEQNDVIALLYFLLTLNIITPFSSDSVANFKQKNIYGESFFWLWSNIHIMHYKLLHKFFFEHKSVVVNQVHVQAKKNKNWNV